MKDVRIIVTGGTIDKVHDPMTEGLAFAKDQSTHIPEILSIGRCHFPRVERIMLKDSLDFDDADRDAIVAAVSASEETAIVVTHGTGTMLRAEEQGTTPEALIDAMREDHASDFERFLISHDHYYSTHSDENRELSELMYNRAREQGRQAPTEQEPQPRGQGAV